VTGQFDAFGIFSGPRGNFMYYWYASLYVVVLEIDRAVWTSACARTTSESPSVGAIAFTVRKWRILSSPLPALSHPESPLGRNRVML
jgi:hypothetical protein